MSYSLDTTNSTANITVYNFTNTPNPITVQEVFDLICQWFLDKGWGKWNGTSIDNTQPHYIKSTTDKIFASLTQPFDVNRRMGLGVKYINVFISESNIYFYTADSYSAINGSGTNIYSYNNSNYITINTNNDFILYLCTTSTLSSFVISEDFNKMTIIFTELYQIDNNVYRYENTFHSLRVGDNTYLQYYPYYFCLNKGSFFISSGGYFFFYNSRSSGNVLTNSYIVSDTYYTYFMTRYYDIKFFNPYVGNNLDIINLKVDSNNFLDNNGTLKQFRIFNCKNVDRILYPES